MSKLGDFKDALGTAKDRVEDFADAAKPVVVKIGETVGDAAEKAAPVAGKVADAVVEKAGVAAIAVKNKAEEVTGKDLDHDGVIGKGQ